MNIENMTSKEISDELSNHGIKMHFNTKRDKLVDALSNVGEIANGKDFSVSDVTSNSKTAEELAKELGVTVLTDDDGDFTGITFATSATEAVGSYVILATDKINFAKRNFTVTS